MDDLRVALFQKISISTIKSWRCPPPKGVPWPFWHLDAGRKGCEDLLEIERPKPLELRVEELRGAWDFGRWGGD